MRETKLYARIKPHLLSWGECSRVENSVESGTPDVFYVCDGYPGWIETKVAKGDYIYFEKFQLPWNSKYHRAGMERLFLIVLDKNDNICVWPMRVVLPAPRVPYEKWTMVCITDLPTPTLKMEPPYKLWKSLRKVLSI